MMAWRKCYFAPVDVIGASDARSLETGGYKHGAFLYPGACAGALRTLCLESSPYLFGREICEQPNEEARNAAQAVGVPGAGGNMTFRFSGPFLHDMDRRRTLLFPLPRFCFWDPNDPVRRTIPAWPAPSSDAVFDRRFDGLQPVPPATAELEPDPRHVNMGELCALLGGNISPRTVDGASRFKTERRSGHARADGGAPLEGMLFSRPVLQFDEQCLADGRAAAGLAGFVSGIDGLSDPIDNGNNLVRLGSGGHCAKVTFEDASAETAQAEALKQAVKHRIATDPSAGLMLYLATPALFSEGWKPPFGEREGVTLRAAAVSDPMTLSGWDMAKDNGKGKGKGGPKPIRRAATPGSTYFYSVDDPEKAAAFIDTRHFNESVSAYDKETGCGLALFGLWPGTTALGGSAR